MREVWPGSPLPRGATFDGRGVNFALYSRVATRVEVCLYDAADPARELERFDLPEVTGAHLARLRAGAAAGRPLRLARPRPLRARARASLQPEQAARRSLRQGRLRRGRLEAAADRVQARRRAGRSRRSTSATAPRGSPRGWSSIRRVRLGRRSAARARPGASTVIYEVHVRGFTMRHPDVPEALRGTYAGPRAPGGDRAPQEAGRLGGRAAAGARVRRRRLPARSAASRNYWGYSTLAYFAPEQRYASARAPGAQVAEFKAMVKALHARRASR